MSPIGSPRSTSEPSVVVSSRITWLPGTNPCRWAFPPGVTSSTVTSSPSETRVIPRSTVPWFHTTNPVIAAPSAMRSARMSARESRIGSKVAEADRLTNAGDHATPMRQVPDAVRPRVRPVHHRRSSNPVGRSNVAPVARASSIEAMSMTVTERARRATSTQDDPSRTRPSGATSTTDRVPSVALLRIEITRRRRIASSRPRMSWIGAAPGPAIRGPRARRVSSRRPWPGTAPGDRRAA